MEEKITHRKMRRLSLVFLSLKQLIAFQNNTLFAFHFNKEPCVTIVTITSIILAFGKTLEVIPSFREAAVNTLSTTELM